MGITTWVIPAASRSFPRRLDFGQTSCKNNNNNNYKKKI